MMVENPSSVVVADGDEAEWRHENPVKKRERLVKERERLRKDPVLRCLQQDQKKKIRKTRVHVFRKIV